MDVLFQSTPSGKPTITITERFISRELEDTVELIPISAIQLVTYSKGTTTDGRARWTTIRFGSLETTIYVGTEEFGAFMGALANVLGNR